ncbi:MAG: type I-B CRISPR-associated protein Cas5b [bacterium]
MKVLKFEISGKYAHFRKPYTTVSPLTFLIPTRPTIAGIIGAILGKPKNDVTCQNANSYIAIGLKENYSVKKIRIGVNLAKVPSNFDCESGYVDLSDIKNKINLKRYECLKDVKYNIYFCHNECILNEFKACLENHTSYYTPYLGISEFIANFEYLGEFDANNVQNSRSIKINSVAPKKYLDENSINFYQDAEYIVQRMPNRLDENRIVKDYTEVIFERKGLPLIATAKKYWELSNGENIIFL